jgi:type IV secretory pathway component VirB8
LETKEYPGLQQAADKASKDAQKFYILIMKSNLISSVLAAALAIYNFHLISHKEVIYIISAILLLISLILTFVIKQSKFEDYWYQGRALAESIKTLTWRFITGSDNFERNLNEDLVRSKFVSSIIDLEKNFPTLASFMNTELATQAPVSKVMDNLRSLPWQERLQYYIKYRIIEQEEWYTSKSKYNQKKKIFWLWIAIVSQLVALICSIILIVTPATDWNFVGFFTTLTATVFAWLQLKQHESLKQAYSTAAIELTQIESLGENINSEVELSRYVLDSENAISREHTLWLAQRRK